MSKIISSLKGNGSDVVEEYAESMSSVDLTSDTGSVCSSETSSDVDAAFSKAKSYSSSLYDVDEKPAGSYSSTSTSITRTKRGNERLRSRRRSQHEIKIA